MTDSWTDRVLRKNANEFLRRQRELIDLQIKRANKEERSAKRVAARNGYLYWIRAVSASCVAAFLLGLSLLVAATACSASRDHSPVLDVLSVTTEQTVHGLTGEVAAKRLLDRISKMQPWTGRPADTYANNWGEDLKVEIPSASVSLVELKRFLRELFVHPIHISGDITSSARGLTFAVRVGDKPGASFSGKNEELDGLFQQAAEFVLRETQPYRYARYLIENNRHDEGVDLLKELEWSDVPVERAWAHVSIGMEAASVGDLITDEEEQRAALKELPTLVQAVNNLIRVEVTLSHDASVLALADSCLSNESKMRKSVAPDWQESAIANCRVYRNEILGDYAEAIRDGSKAPLDRVYGPLSVAWLIEGQMFSHDLDGAVQTSLAKAPPDVQKMVRAYVELERGGPNAVKLWDDLYNEDKKGQLPQVRDVILRFSGSYLALARAESGDLSGAQQLIGSTPLDCYRCARFRGKIAQLADERDLAEKWFADAIGQAPLLPQAYIDRGQARLSSGDKDGALQDANRAVELGPHNADAWKLLGDILVKESRFQEALQKYDAAKKYSPHWNELNAARELATASTR
jgi:hypothetical protein